MSNAISFTVLEITCGAIIGFVGATVYNKVLRILFEVQKIRIQFSLLLTYIAKKDIAMMEIMRDTNIDSTGGDLNLDLVEKE